jgi:hypothetical protein
MDKCARVFSDNFTTKINDTEISIFTGALDINGKIKEENCNLDREYDICKRYLDTLSRIKKLLLLLYTKGSVSKMITDYHLNNIIFTSPIFMSSYKMSLYDSITDLIKYRYTFRVNDDDFYKNFFDNIIIWLTDKFLNIISEVLDNYNNSSFIDYISDNYFIDLEDENVLIHLSKLEKIFIKMNKKKRVNFIIRILMYRMKTKTETETDTLEKFVTYLLDKYFDNYYELTKNDNINANIKLYYKQIENDINEIVNNTPPIDRCIRLFRAATNYKSPEYDIGKIVQLGKITSTTCSQKTNIAFFTNSNGCCIAEFIVKPGTRVLFLNYDETAYGEKMYEVILQKDIRFQVIKIEKKTVVKLNFEEEDSINSTNIIKIKYEEPTIHSLNTINVFLLDQI